MARPEQSGTETKEAAKEQPGKVEGAAVQATTVNGLKGLNNSTLIEIVNDKAARPETRTAALTEIHGRRGGQYSGLEMLETEMLVTIVEDQAVPQVVRTAAADALALPRTADKTEKADKSDKS